VLRGRGAILKLIFRNSTPGSASKGPVVCFRIDGEVVSDGKGTTLARHVDHQWQVDGRRYLRLDCEDAVSVHFERAAAASEVYGPFTHFSSTDGICYADHEVFAHFDEHTRSWFSHRNREYWPALVVRSV
jgi:hypothetical protein